MPSFAIEVPGEANPLTETTIINTLQSASSSNPTQIQTGTKQLQQWEKDDLYYRHLQSAYLDRRLPTEVRYLAIIQLKNGIDKYWRKTASNAVSKEDKHIIRSRLVEGVLYEEKHQLAVQSALVVAKIARYEYPNDWPEAISAFVNCLRDSNTPQLQIARALLALLHIIKELSTGRLQRTRQYLQAATPEIIGVIRQIYAHVVQPWLSQPTASRMELSLLAVKTIRRLLISGYEHPNRESEVASVWSLSIEHLGSFLSLLNASLPPDIYSLVGKHAVQLAKLHLEMARDHPAAFALLPKSLELSHSYWGLIKDFGNTFGSKAAVLSATTGTDGDATHDRPYIEKIVLKGLLIVRACVKMVHSPAQTFKYRTPEDKEEKNRAAEIIRQVMLTNTFVTEAMEIVVMRFFVFRESDLREWLEDPEEWEKREEGDGEDWEFSVRSCSEKLFLDLAINYKEIIVQPLLNVFYSVANPQNDDVLFKDAVYTAVGLSASVIHPYLDFDAFVRDVLITEVQNESAGWNILRRRAAILLGQWVPVKIAQQSRPLIYQIFQHLLNRDDPLNDRVVRVTAGRQLVNVANDWEFEVERFTPYAETILTQLMLLIDEVELSETKMALLNSISVIVERLQTHISPFAERIVGLLPGLWRDSGDEHLMKQAILTILARLVNAMKFDSLPLHSLVFPIIKGAVEPGSETQVYLLEDALDLWSAVMVQTPSQAVTPELLDLVQYLYLIYELGSENLRSALEITESYIILAPVHMLSADVRRKLFSSLSKLFGSLRADANGLVCNIVETMLRFSQKAEVASALPLGEFSDASFMITYDLFQAADPETGLGIFTKLLQGLRGSYIAHCTTGPRAQDAPVDGIVETDYFSILARTILGSQTGFLYTCQAVASTSTTLFSDDGSDQQQQQQPTSALEALMTWLLEEWFSHLENIGDPARRKLMCLALTKLLDTNQPFILLRLQSLMTVWTDVVTELRENAEDTGTVGDCLLLPRDAAAATTGDPATTTTTTTAEESPEEARRREMTRTDEVHTVNLPELIQMHLRSAVEACGGNERFNELWLVNVDKDVVQGFLDLGINVIMMMIILRRWEIS